MTLTPDNYVPLEEDAEMQAFVSDLAAVFKKHKVFTRPVTFSFKGWDIRFEAGSSAGGTLVTVQANRDIYYQETFKD